MHVDEGGGQLRVDVPTKLEPIDVILLSSPAKKFQFFFYLNFVFGRNKKWKFADSRGLRN